MGSEILGRCYRQGELIVRQGDVGNCMFVVQEGEVEVGSIVRDRPACGHYE